MKVLTDMVLDALAVIAQERAYDLRYTGADHPTVEDLTIDYAHDLLRKHDADPARYSVHVIWNHDPGSPFPRVEITPKDAVTLLGEASADPS